MIPLTMAELKQVRVDAPCGADWDRMQGTDRVRYCSGCRKNVYHLSDLTPAEARRLLARLPGTPCVRFETDETCAPVLREATPMWRRLAALAAGLLLTLTGGAFPRPAHADAPAHPVATHQRHPVIHGMIVHRRPVVHGMIVHRPMIPNRKPPQAGPDKPH